MVSFDVESLFINMSLKECIDLMVKFTLGIGDFNPFTAKGDNVLWGYRFQDWPRSQIQKPG